MAEADGAGLKKLKRSIGQIGPVRLLAAALFVLAGLWVARYSPTLPLAGDAERALYDWRFFRVAERVTQQDDRIVLITYDDDTLIALGKRSPLDRHLLAETLRALDAMHPHAIGIDILIDQPQAEDPELIQTMRALHTPTYLGYARPERGNEAQIAFRQEQFLSDFLRQVGTGPVRPTSIRLEPDSGDGTVRRWTAERAGLPPLFANALSRDHPEFASYAGAIDFRVPGTADNDQVPLFTNLPIQFVGQMGEALRPQIEGRYVLIGGNINDLDDFPTPLTRFTGQTAKGLEVHAQMLAQQLDGRMPKQLPVWIYWAAAMLVVALGALTSVFELRGWRLVLALAVQIALVAGVPIELQALHFDTIDTPAVGWGLGWILAFVGVGAAARAVGSEQRRFAQSALGKYLPADVAREIMRDPDRLALTGEHTVIDALFTDLEGFTKLSHAITPEVLSRLLNRYLDLMSDIVLKHGGTLDKFVGDALVTFWGAPIARADDADRAVRAGREMYEAGETFRSMASEIAGEEVPPIGVTRVGLHRGEAVVGNFGGEGRIQYTALGDAMNCAARLESANKQLKSTMLVSDETKRESSLDIFRPLGRIVLSGRATPVMVWEPVPGMDPDLRGRLNALWEAFDEGHTEALVQLESIAAEHKADAALQDFVYRCREVGPGGHFVLGSK